MLTFAQKAFRRTVWNQCGYNPSVEQQLFHACEARLKQVAGGVGAGKSVSAAREVDPYSSIPNGLGWIVGPDYDQAKPIFDYLLNPYLELGIVRIDTVSAPNRGSRRFVTEWGFEWVTKSAGDPVSLASRRPDVIVSDETAQSPNEIFYKLLERATEKRAPVIMTGTFESSLGWYADTWERWQGSNPERGVSFSLPTWSNRRMYPGGRSDPALLEVEGSMPADLFQERYGGIPCKPVGLVFKEFDRKKHLKPLAELFNPALPVEIWCDPATHCYPILFVQIQADGKTVHILDEIYAKDRIAQQIIPEVIETPWWKHSCKEGVMDIAGTFRAGANTSQLEVWATELERLKQHAINWKSTKIFDALDWYDAIHLRLNGDDPLLLIADHLNDRIDGNGNANGIVGELKTHRWPDRAETASLPRRPVKRNEDALSALGYGFLVHFGPVVERAKHNRRVKRAYFW